MIQFYLDYLLPFVLIVFSTPAKPAYWLGRRCFSGFIPVCMCVCVCVCVCACVRACVGVCGCCFGVLQRYKWYVRRLGPDL